MNKYFNDTDQTKLAHIVNVYDLPEDVNQKEASEDEFISYSDLAYPERGLYPVNTPLNVKLAYCYASDDDSIPADIRERVLNTIKTAADFWQVELPKKKEVAAVHPSYSIKISHEDGSVENQDIFNDSELKDVVKYMAKHASEFPYDTRRQIAESILEAPENLRKQLTRNDIVFLQKTAGDQFVSPLDVKVACMIRSTYVKNEGHPELADILDNVPCKANQQVTKPMIVKLASMFDRVDRVTGLNRLYGTELATPEDSLNGVAKIDVELFNNNVVAMKNGSAVVKSDIIENRDKVEEFFSKISGEDVTAINDTCLFEKIANLSDIEAEAFNDITALCLGKE